MDGDGAAGSIPAATNAGTILASRRRHVPSVDGNFAAGFTVAATNAGTAEASRRHQRAHLIFGRLGIDGEAVLSGDIDAAIDGQAAPVRQNQVDIAGDGDAVIDVNCSFSYIPAAFPFDIIRSHLCSILGYINFFFCYRTVIIYNIVYILFRLFPRLPPRRNGQEQEQA